MSKEEFYGRAKHDSLGMLSSFLKKVRGKAWTGEELAPIWKKSQGSDFSTASLIMAELNDLCESKQVDYGKWIYYFPTTKEIREKKNLKI